MEVTLSKVLLQRAHDAVREVVQFYQQHFAEREMAGQNPADAQLRWMRELRSLRDDLTAVGQRQPAVLRVDKASAQLMVSCAVFAMESLADKAPARGFGRDPEPQSAQEMHELTSLAKEFLAEPVKVIERPRRRTPFPASVAAVIERLDTQVPANRGRRLPPAAQNSAPPAPAGGILLEDSLHEQWAGSGTQARNLIPEVEDDVAPLRSPGFEAGACIDFEASRAEKPGAGRAAAPASKPRPQPQLREQPPTPQQAPPRRAAPARLAKLPATASAAVAGDTTELSVNLRAVQEPQLRASVELNCAGLRSALATEDDRLAAVMLCAALEGVVLDVAMRRRQEFQLRGQPDTWNLPLLVRRLASEHGVEADRSALIYALDCARLLHPAAQLTAPITIDRDTVARMVGSVQRFVNALGFAAASSRA